MFVGMGANGAGGDYNLTDSLRFRSSASAYLERTPASAGNLTTWTWSGWIKRGTLGTSQDLFAVDYAPDNQNFHWIGFNTSNALDFGLYPAGVTARLTTTQVFRDPSAWYHIVAVWNTTSATADDRLQLYVNGVQVSSFSSRTNPTQNTNGFINTTNLHTIGDRYYNNSHTNFFDGYMTEVNFVDGQALTQDDFGEYNEDTGVWQPKEYTGTYGTNGFYINGNTSGSTVLDESSNSNNWASNNMNLTTSTATTYDIMSDVPTLTDEDTANFAVFNPIAPSGLSTNRGTTDLSNGNLSNSDTASLGLWGGSESTILMSTSKYYAEFTIELSSSTDVKIGINGAEVTDHVFRTASNVGYQQNGNKWINSSPSAYGATYTNGDVIGVAFDADAQSVTFYKNNVSQGAIAVPNLVNRLGYTFYAAVGWNGGIKPYVHGNFGQRPFAYTPPTGYKKLNTYNLPDSSIEDGSQYMNTALYTGDGVPIASGGQPITGVGFSPDFVWVKSRGQATNHFQFDTIRGATNYLRSSTTDGEGTNPETLNSFDTDGFTVGNSTSFNTSPYEYVAWNWKAGGTAVSNTDGTITSQVSANPTAGFSVVTWTGVGGTSTIGHGLGVAPKFIITKLRNVADGWYCYHADIGNTKFIRLDTTGVSTTSTIFGNTSPTSTVFTFELNVYTAVAYCFAEVEGYSEFGSYTGNGSADGTFVYTGFRPAFVIIKQTDAVRNWMILDSTRDSYNQGSTSLQPNTANAETVSNERDYLSNGFKLRSTATNTNASGGTYIYIAFAENPFKNSLAR